MKLSCARCEAENPPDDMWVVDIEAFRTEDRRKCGSYFLCDTCYLKLKILIKLFVAGSVSDGEDK